MPSRREFLQTGAAVSAAAMNGLLVPAAMGAGAARSSVAQIVVYDDRYPQAREMAATVAAHGAALRPIERGDVTRFWYDELDLLWRKSPVAIAGITQFGPMFALERLGADRGLQLALRSEHPAAAAPALAAQPSPIHYYVPYAVQQGHAAAVDGPLFSWLLAPRNAFAAVDSWKRG
jgi:hypothetical protein